MYYHFQPLLLSSQDQIYCVFQELGDVENWAASIENDLGAVANSLEYLRKNSISFTPHPNR